MRLGDEITFTARFRRTRGDKRRQWQRLNMPPHDGIYIGTRTLWEGTAEWEGEDEGMVFRPVRHFDAALVVFHPRRNPMYVPLDAIVATPPSDLGEQRQATRARRAGDTTERE